MHQKPTEGTARRVLLVDDDSKLLRLLAMRLERDGYSTISAGNGREALATMSQVRPDIVITDVRMEGMDGLALFDVLHEREPTLPVVILTAHGTIPDAVAATQKGVFAYMTKPFDSEELVRIISRALLLPGRDNDTSTRVSDDEWCSDIVHNSRSMQSLLSRARRIAWSDANVLLQGESGTGKELLARAIHRGSPRHEGPFLAVNCMAIPEALFESEFFGHRRGAFTGATEDRQGLLAAASGGTLLLDEIADMPPAFQGKLLRVLQEKEVRQVGAGRATSVDVRIISASHQDLMNLVEQREFRADLYYRLNGVTLEIPSLSARREDVPLLAEKFLAAAQSRPGAGPARGFSRESMELLVGTNWPGNIRQLRNVIEQCAVLETSALISADLVKQALRGKGRKILPFAEARDRFEFDYLVQLLTSTSGNVAQAARLAERNRSEFYSLLKKHGLNPDSFRDAAQAD